MRRSSAQRVLKTYGGLSQNAEYKLVRVPKGYEPDNPAAEFLKFKSYVATAHLKDEDVLATDGVKKIVKAFEALQPLVAFINKGLE